MRHFLLTLAAIGLTIAPLSSNVCGQHALTRLSANRQDALKKFLQDYVQQQRLPPDESTAYIPAFVDLNGDGKDEAIVYLTGRWWCGSGGCVTLILDPQNESYRVVTRVTITRPPIRLLTERSNGWHDISVMVYGGGISAHEAQLGFNGHTYPANPSVPPARPLTNKTVGRIIISASQKGVPLYP